MPGSGIVGKGSGGNLGLWLYPASYCSQERREVYQLAHAASPSQHGEWASQLL